MKDMEATEQISLPGMHVLYPEVILIINVQLMHVLYPEVILIINVQLKS